MKNKNEQSLGAVTHTHKYSLKNNKAITLVALIVTVVILIILAGVTINMMLVNDGILNRTKTATEEYNKQTATESINLKITTCQMNTYAEEHRMPTLKELAVELEKDDEIQYVNDAQRVASTQDINFTTATSIFTKLKAYPYEFEINSSLRLASIDGVQVASIPKNDDDTIVSMTKRELKKMIQDEIAAATLSSNKSNNYSTTIEQVVGTWIDGTTEVYQKTFETTLPAVGLDRVIDISDLNSNNIIDIEINYNKNNEYMTGNGYGSNYVYSGIWNVNNKKSITIRNTKNSGASLENAQCFITLKYTKNPTAQ